MNQALLNPIYEADFSRKNLQRPLHCRHPLKTLEELNTMVLSADSNSLAQNSRPRLTGDHPIWLGALALSLLLHGGLLLTEFRTWQSPQSSASQTQHVSLSLSGMNAAEETESATAEPPIDNRQDSVEPVVEPEPLIEPAPVEPEHPLNEAVVLTQEGSVLELPAPEPETAAMPEPAIGAEPPPPSEPDFIEEPPLPAHAPSTAAPTPTEVHPETTATSPSTETPSLAAIAPSEPGFSEADRVELMDDYLQEIMRRLQSAFEYPSAALRRRQQGEVMLELLIEDSGDIASVRLEAGSGFALLDDAALAMVRRLAPLPPLPEHFPDGRLQLGVPVVFRLQ